MGYLFVAAFGTICGVVIGRVWGFILQGRAVGRALDNYPESRDVNYRAAWLDGISALIAEWR